MISDSIIKNQQKSNISLIYHNFILESITKKKKKMTPHPKTVRHLFPFILYLVNAAGTPPSTVNIHPVVLSAFDEAKNAILSAISFG